MRASAPVHLPAPGQQEGEWSFWRREGLEHGASKLFLGLLYPLGPPVGALDCYLGQGLPAALTLISPQVLMAELLPLVSVQEPLGPPPLALCRAVHSLLCEGGQHFLTILRDEPAD